MNSTMPPAARDTIFRLSSEVGSFGLAVECRDAALRFLDEMNSEDAGKLSLLVWLTGTYAALTAHATQMLDERADASLDVDTAYRSIDARSIDTLFKKTREEVFATLEVMTTAEGAYRISRDAIEAGLVMKCEDASGEMTYAPVGLKTLSLSDRIISLFVVDCLVRSEDYRTMRVCRKCAAVHFDAHSHSGGCDETSRLSGVYSREAKQTIPPSKRKVA